MEHNANEFTTILATYGAILATLSFGLSLILGIKELRKSRPKIHIKVSFGRYIDRDGENSESLIIIDAHNQGLVPVILTGYGWLNNDKTMSHIVKPYLAEFPYNLAQRRVAQVYYACRWFKELKGNEKIIGVYFQDEEGNMWKSKITKKHKKIIEGSESNGYLIQWNSKLGEYYRE
jgi:hypothetical protein